MRRFAAILVAGIVGFGVARASVISSRVPVLDYNQVTNPLYLLRQDAVVNPAANGPEGPQFQVQFTADRGRIRQLFDSPLDWSDQDMLTWCVTNHENRTVDITLLFQVRQDQNDYTGHLAYQMSIPAGQTVRYVMFFRETDASQFGVRHYPPILDTRFTRINVSQSFQRNSIWSWRFVMMNPQPALITFADFSTLTQRRDFDGVADQFFQYAYRHWSGKIQSVSDMLAARDAEAVDLAANPGPGLTEGTTSLPNQGTNARWRVRTINGRKYLVHPSGRPFWSFGIQGVNDGMATWIDNRSNMFQFLPDPNGPDGDLYGTFQREGGQGGGTVTSLRVLEYNLRRKYGTSHYSSWLARTRQRLLSWGINTLGPSCVEDLYDNSMPYTVYMNTGDFPTRLTTPAVHWRTLPDPYASNFESWMVNHFRDRVRNHNGRSNFMGVFVDNEQSWGHMMDGTLRTRYSIAIGALQAPMTQPAKAAFVQYLTQKYTSVTRLNSAWGTRFASWNTVRAPLNVEGVTFNNSMQVDLRTFTQRFATAYFSKVKRALNQVGSTGLYLGCRFWHHTPEVIAAAATSVDVLCFNNYARPGDFPWQYLSSLSKPVIISEWSNPINARGSVGWVNMTLDESRTEIVTMLTQALRNPNIVGLHYFGMYDLPVTGHAGNYWNIGFGSVDICDTPKSDVVAAFRQMGASLYSVRSSP